MKFTIGVCRILYGKEFLEEERPQRTDQSRREQPQRKAFYSYYDIMFRLINARKSNLIE